MIYENWASSEPSGATDDCAIIGENIGSGFQWDDKSCNDQFGFLCQRGSSLEVIVCVVYVKVGPFRRIIIFKIHTSLIRLLIHNSFGTDFVITSTCIDFIKLY